MTTIEAVIFGMMLSWTPCVLLIAHLMWRAPLEPDEQHHIMSLDYSIFAGSIAAIK